MTHETLILSLALSAILGCQTSSEPDKPATSALFTAQEIKHILQLSPIPPPPPNPTNQWADNPDAAAVGRLIFYDTRFSANGQVSCATCHQPQQSWTDGLHQSLGVGQTPRHAPSLWNSANQRWLFWDGRADTLWAQALEPLEDPLEHGGSRLQYAHLIYADMTLREDYEAVFGQLPRMSDKKRFPPQGRPVDNEPEHPHQQAWATLSPTDQDAITHIFVNMGKSLEAFQRGFVSTNAPFDVFVTGLREGQESKQSVLSDEAQRGLKLFIGKARCHLCHDGPLFSDLEFHNTGIRPLTDNQPADSGRAEGITRLQQSRFNGKSRWSDAPDAPVNAKLKYLPKPETAAGQFKTPSLRNVNQTAPYMHQGQLSSLEEVVEFYATLDDADLSNVQEKILQPLALTDTEKKHLVSFLNSLGDSELPGHLLPP
jgi:cytochrome c peroxidase